MKALTIRQPFASMIADHLKEYETRGWYTSYRGPLLIHSGKCWTIKNQMAKKALDIAAEFYGVEKMLALPIGCAICVVDLTDCIKMTPEFIEKQRILELAVGVWEPDRYAWKLENPRPLDPVQLRGKQGIWNADLCAACQYNTNDIVCHPHCGGCDGASCYEGNGG